MVFYRWWLYGSRSVCGESDMMLEVVVVVMSS